ncbi:MAG: CDGSH iron-sulfur domain-containing protein [Devosiaceae bacterium]|nr:CDGSH iron-sulfur domain-containing protein [Devosiaceae bacterium]
MSAKFSNTMRIITNGPVELLGDIQIEGHENSTSAYLCRCGLSKNKPYCDGSHKNGDFVASGEIQAKEPAPLEQSGGPLTVSPRNDGPNIINGNVQIISDSGKHIDQRTKLAMCRCGHSKNKPFCDGAHKAIGFKADGT